MNTKQSRKWGLACAVVTAAAAAATMIGCELLVDFDRSKIPADASVPDGATQQDSSASMTGDAQIDSATAPPGDDTAPEASQDDMDSATDGLPPIVDSGPEAGGSDAAADAPADSSGDDGGADADAAD